MDILNFISWIASRRRVVTSAPDDALVPIGIRTETRDDKYTTVAIKKSDLITVPEPAYKVYTALLTQNIDEPPVANILENTIGDIVWTRNSGGIYYGTLTGAFTDKTFLQGAWGSSGIIYGAPAYIDDTTNVGTFIMITKEDSNHIRVSTLAFPEAFGDGLLQSFPIEIRVYN